MPCKWRICDTHFIFNNEDTMVILRKVYLSILKYLLKILSIFTQVIALQVRGQTNQIDEHILITLENILKSYYDTQKNPELLF